MMAIDRGNEEPGSCEEKPTMSSASFGPASSLLVGPNKSKMINNIKYRNKLSCQ